MLEPYSSKTDFNTDIVTKSWQYSVARNDWQTCYCRMSCEAWCAVEPVELRVHVWFVWRRRPPHNESVDVTQCRSLLWSRRLSTRHQQQPYSTRRAYSVTVYDWLTDASLMSTTGKRYRNYNNAKTQKSYFNTGFQLVTILHSSNDTMYDPLICSNAQNEVLNQTWSLQTSLTSSHSIMQLIPYCHISQRI